MIVASNARTMAVSEYSIFALDVLEYEGELYFVRSAGLVKLDATGTELVSGSFQTGEMHLAGRSIGIVPRVYASVREDGALTLTAKTKLYGVEHTDEYAIAHELSDVSRGRVVNLGKGVKSESWQMEVSSAEPGVNWGLSDLEAVVWPTKRSR